MLVSLLSALLGIFGAALPEVFKMLKEKKEMEHEAKMFELQMQHQQLNHQIKLEEVNAYADIAEMYALNSRTPETKIEWVNALDRLVRPLMAYWFMLLYTLLKCAQVYSAMQGNPDLPWLEARGWWDSIASVWGEEDQAVFVTIVTYYFGKRSFEKYRSMS